MLSRPLLPMFDSPLSFHLHAATLAGACGGSSSTPASTATSAPAESPSATHIYVSDETGGNVLVVDPETGRLVEKIAVGKRPAASSSLPTDGNSTSRCRDRRSAAPASTSPSCPPRIDPPTVSAWSTSRPGRWCESSRAARIRSPLRSRRTARLCIVSNEEPPRCPCSIVATGNVTIGSKWGRAGRGDRSPRRARGLRHERGDNAVFAIDTTSFAVVAKIDTAARPRAVAFTPDGTTAFVTNENGGAITVVDAAKHAVTSTIKLTPPPAPPFRRDRWGRRSRRTRASCSSPSGRAKSVVAIDVATRQVVRTMDDMGATALGCGREPGRHEALYGERAVRRCLGRSTSRPEKSKRKIAVGGSPWGIAVAP